MDNSLKGQRFRFYLDSLSSCDNDKERIKLLIERVVELEFSILELQDEVVNLRHFALDSCVPVPF